MLTVQMATSNRPVWLELSKDAIQMKWYCEAGPNIEETNLWQAGVCCKRMRIEKLHISKSDVLPALEFDPYVLNMV